MSEKTNTPANECTETATHEIKTRSMASYDAAQARLLKTTDGLSETSVGALKALLRITKNHERGQTVFISCILFDTAGYLDKGKKGEAQKCLTSARKIIGSQLFRGMKGKTLAILSEHAGIKFDAQGAPNECLDKDKIMRLSMHLAKQGMKLNRIKTEAAEKAAPKFDAWSEAQRFIEKLGRLANDESAPAEFKRTVESIAGTLNSLSVKLENKSLTKS